MEVRGRGRTAAADRQVERAPGQGRPARLAGLDGLRALAVTAVLVYHADPDWLPGGFLGVDVFFVVSGFLITTLLLGEHARAGRVDLPAFWLRRARRLLPALWALLLVTTAALLVGWPQEVARVRADVLASLGYVTNWELLARHQSYFDAAGRPSVVQHLWSLAVEEQFYLLWPPLLVALLTVGRPGPRAALRRVALAAAAGAAASTVLMAVLAARADVPYGSDGSREYFGTDTHAMGLMAGAVLAALRCARWPRLPRGLGGTVGRALGRAAGRVADGLGALALLALGLVAWRVGEVSPGLYRHGGFLAVSLLAAVVVAAAVRTGGRLGPLLDRQPLRWLGERSYGLYLWHWPVFVLTRPELDLPWGPWPTLALRLAVTLALTEACHRWVERPVRSGALDPWLRSVAAHLRQLARAVPLPGVPATAGLPRVGWRGAGAAVVGLAVVGAVTAGAAAARPVVPRAEQVLASRPMAALPTQEPATAPPTTAAATAPTTAPTTAGPTSVPAPTGTGTPGTGPAAPGTSRPTSAATAVPAVSAVGDSVMSGAAAALARALPGVRVDAEEGRQVRDAFAAVRRLAAAGTLAPVVVLHTGSNGPIKRSELEALLAELADRRRVVLVDDHVPRAWERPNEKVIAAAAAAHPNVVVAHWNALASAHPDWLYDDGIHVRPGHQADYAALVARAVNALGRG
ncbi:MAG TPA: acyltransferase family protein [Motilibacteraceae bacterium]|nr:acyltransferase family protein [Motilibacteraceae bacterium]